MKLLIKKSKLDNNDDEVQSHHSSERPQESQAKENLEDRVNKNMGVHSQKSEFESEDEDDSVCDIDGIYIKFANCVGDTKPNEINDVLKKADIDSQIIDKAIK